MMFAVVVKNEPPSQIMTESGQQIRRRTNSVVHVLAELKKMAGDFT